MLRPVSRVSFCVLAALLLLHVVGPEWLHTHAPFARSTVACAGCAVSVEVGDLPDAAPLLTRGDEAIGLLAANTVSRDDRMPVCEVLSRGPPGR